MQINQNLLIKGMFSLAACSIITGCVDDKYDLSDIDTSSRFTVDNLTVPVNLSTIELKNVIEFDDNENIKTLTDKNGNQFYAISKGGEINTSNFQINPVSVNKLSIAPTKLSIGLPNVTLIPGKEITIPTIHFESSDAASYKFEMNNVDESLLALTSLKTTSPLDIQIILSVPDQLAGSKNTITFDNLVLQLPWGLVLEDNSYKYNKDNGELTISSLTVDSEGKAKIDIHATGLDLGDKGVVKDKYLGISGDVRIVSGDLNMTLNTSSLPKDVELTANYSVPGFQIASVSGKIDYKMETINIEPISLNDLPDFLDGPDTQIRIANPAILLSINNPAGKYGLSGTGKITLSSEFKNGETKDHTSDLFTLSGDECNLAFCTEVEGYTTVAFDGLRDILANGNSGLPNKIYVTIQDIEFAGEVTDLPLDNIGNARGEYEFNAPLGFAEGSQVIYESTEDGWSGDDLSNININNLNVSAICSTNIPVGIELRVIPVDRNGNEIQVTEDSSRFEVPANSQNQPVELNIKGANGQPIHDIDGIKFIATVTQNNAGSEYTKPLGPNQYITLDNLKAKVSGYYDYVEDKK